MNILLVPAILFIALISVTFCFSLMGMLGFIRFMRAVEKKFPKEIEELLGPPQFFLFRLSKWDKALNMEGQPLKKLAQNDPYLKMLYEKQDKNGKWVTKMLWVLVGFLLFSPLVGVIILIVKGISR